MNPRIIEHEMIDWSVSHGTDFAGYIAENNVTRILIHTELEENCAYSMNVQVGKGNVYPVVLAVEDGILYYDIPLAMLKESQLQFQVIGVFDDEKIKRSNIWKYRVKNSLVDPVEIQPEEISAFEQALANYSSQLSLAVQSATDAKNSAAMAIEAKDGAELAQNLAESAKNTTGIYKDSTEWYYQATSDVFDRTAAKVDEAYTHARNALDASEKAEKSLDELKEGIASGEFKGDKGDAGPIGPAGERGADGLPGRDGVDGRDGRDGTDATVTAESIETALGYVPADAEEVVDKDSIRQLSETKVGYSEVVNGQLLMYSDDTKTNLLATLDLPLGGGISDVKIGDDSIVTDGVANIPIGGIDKLGLFQTNYFGITANANGILQVSAANANGINTRNPYSLYAPIVPAQLDYAVKAALTDGKGAAYTETEQASARERLGIISAEGVYF